MEIIVRKLNSNIKDDYIDFFDNTPHSTNQEEHRCYCVCWSGLEYTNDDFSTANKRREFAKKYIEEDKIRGYLAYLDDKVIGWCNANNKSECIGCMSWKMFMNDIKLDDIQAGLKVKSVFCFAINPLMRRKGIAKLLLEKVIMDAETDGYDYIEAYPLKKFSNTEDDFMGPVDLFIKFGFMIEYETNDRVIMRKRLK